MGGVPLFSDPVEVFELGSQPKVGPVPVFRKKLERVGNPRDFVSDLFVGNLEASSLQATRFLNIDETGVTALPNDQFWALVDHLRGKLGRRNIGALSKALIDSGTETILAFELALRERLHALDRPHNASTKTLADGDILSATDLRTALAPDFELEPGAWRLDSGDLEQREYVSAEVC